jgi:APA family basic amino acid/polyamine antiporter
MATALVVGNMIGSGVFLLPASLAPYGGISVVGWLVTTTGALLLALVFARLSRLVPRVGGPYAYTRIGFGDFAAFLVAWGYWISIWVANAAIAVAFVSYLTVFWPALRHSPVLAALVALSAIWLSSSFHSSRWAPSASSTSIRTTCGPSTRAV